MNLHVPSGYDSQFAMERSTMLLRTVNHLQAHCWLLIPINITITIWLFNIAMEIDHFEER